MTELQQKIFLDRYSLKDEKGNPLEKSPQEMWRRVAKGIATSSEEEKEFYNILEDFKFIPGGRILASAGTGIDITSYNCFLANLPKDSTEGILNSLKEFAEMMRRGGGVGITLSSLRPNGCYIKKVNGFSSGPIVWGELFTVMTRDIIQMGGCFSGDTKILTNKGLIPIKEIISRFRLGESFSCYTHEGWKPVIDTFINGVKDIYKITFSSGKEIKLTANHKVITKSFEDKEVKDLSKGDELISLVGEWGKDIPSEISEEQAYIWGAYLGSGYIGSIADKEFVAFHTNKSFDRLKLCIKNVFNSTLDIHNVNHDAIGISTSLSLRLFCNIDSVPKYIFESSESVVKAFLDGYMDFYQDGLDQDIQLLFQSLGYHVTISEGKIYLENKSTPFFSEKIENISCIGKQETFNLTVADVHKLCANGIYVNQSRRGACLIMLHDWHPDCYYPRAKYPDGKKNGIHDFISRKTDSRYLLGANISVGISDKFMEAVKNDGDWEFKFPDTNFEKYDSEWDGDLDEWESKGYPVIIYEKIKAREFWQELCKCAWKSGEPGLLFIERANKWGNLAYKYKLRGTNPCLIDNTRILTKDGLVEIKDLEGKEFEIYNGNGEWVKSRAWKSGTKPVYRLQLSNGLYLEATDDHILEDWKKDHIQLKDASNSLFKPFLADGNWTGSEDINEQDAIFSGLTFGFSLRDKFNFSDKGELRPVTEDLELLDHIKELPKIYATDNLPKKLFKQSPRIVCAFLRGLCSATGTILKNRVILKLGKQKVAEEVQLLLNALGINSSITEKYYVSIPSSLKFKNLIGFIQASKNAKLSLSEKGIKPITVKSIEYIGDFDVYDFSEPITNWGWANGLKVHNCAEIFLEPYSVCNLGMINLSALVKDGTFDWEQYKTLIKGAVRFLDNVIDISFYPLKQNEENQKKIRRIGLGVTGLADALIKLKIRYGTKKSFDLVDKWFKILRDTAYEASALLAKEKGPCPAYDENMLTRHFLQTLPESVKDLIKKYGLRNGYLIAQQPSGTTSLLAGTSSGIEPVFDFKTIRRDRLGEHVIYHPLLQQYFDEHPGSAPADYFVSANDLSVEDHIEIQARAAAWIDQGISKTINAPKTHTIEDVEKAYMLAYDRGLKTIAYYRDGSRDEQVLYHSQERPQVLKGETHKVKTPQGNLYLTLNRDDKNNPYEIFLLLGKAGNETLTFLEALARISSLYLRSGGTLEKIAEELTGIASINAQGFGKKKIYSVPDAIGKTLKDISGSKLEVTSLHELRSTLETCPECGSPSLVKEEGCEKCLVCGFTKC